MIQKIDLHYWRWLCMLLSTSRDEDSLPTLHPQTLQCHPSHLQVSSHPEMRVSSQSKTKTYHNPKTSLHESRQPSKLPHSSCTLLPLPHTSLSSAPQTRPIAHSPVSTRPSLPIFPLRVLPFHEGSNLDRETWRRPFLWLCHKRMPYPRSRVGVGDGRFLLTCLEGRRSGMLSLLRLMVVRDSHARGPAL